jgi:hypothetical protein
LAANVPWNQRMKFAAEWSAIRRWKAVFPARGPRQGFTTAAAQLRVSWRSLPDTPQRPVFGHRPPDCVRPRAFRDRQRVRFVQPRLVSKKRRWLARSTRGIARRLYGEAGDSRSPASGASGLFWMSCREIGPERWPRLPTTPVVERRAEAARALPKRQTSCRRILRESSSPSPLSPQNENVRFVQSRNVRFHGGPRAPWRRSESL